MDDDIQRRIDEEMTALRNAFGDDMRELCSAQGWLEPVMLDHSLCSFIAKTGGAGRMVWARNVHGFCIKPEMPCKYSYPADKPVGAWTTNRLLVRNAEIPVGYWCLKRLDQSQVLAFALTLDGFWNAGGLNTMVEYMARECGELEIEITAYLGN